MRRGLIVGYGVVCYLIFFATFLYLIAFVEGAYVPRTVDAGPPAPAGIALAIDLALIALFGLQHSVMARQGFKRWWTRLVPASMERSTFVLAASLALLLLMWQWRPLPATVWRVEDEGGRLALYALSGGGWLLLLLSTYLIDHFELFGLRQVYEHLRGQTAAAPVFKTPGWYRFVRHPIYLGFIVAFFAAPVMTVGRLLFSVAMTGYILIGIHYEERDLVRLFGDRYLSYREQAGMLLPWRRSPVRPAASGGAAAPRA